mgnify:CR=1 FL=1
MSLTPTIDGVVISAPISPEYAAILTPEALAFVADLQRQFNARRLELLDARTARQARIEAGEMPDFLPDTADIRAGEWQVGNTPDDLQRRWTEITGPVERKMIINALNSGADCYMADFEDSNAPSWDNNLQGHINLRDAVRREITFTNPDNGKFYQLNETVATLLVRPRGWHLDEKHVTIDGQPMSGSLFDFGLYFFHNAHALLERGSGPYFYLPKLESHLEARLWNDVFNRAQDALNIPRGTIKVTVLIENILAAFEMEEILYELREHIVGLNAGRWDYIFSAIRKFRHRGDFVLPDRAQVTMTVPFMRAYTELLVRSCHKRGAHAIGGMSAYIPSRKDPEVNERALAAVRADKEREVNDGFDGTWVAHPDLVAVARKPFELKLGDHPHQKERLREDVQVTAAQLLDLPATPGEVTEQGFRMNISVALQYIAAWLDNNGCVPIYNLMEDAATAEISRAQLWQWIHNSTTLADGRPASITMFRAMLPEELEKIKGMVGEAAYTSGKYARAAELLDLLVSSDQFPDFLTLIAYKDLA